MAHKAESIPLKELPKSVTSAARRALRLDKDKKDSSEASNDYTRRKKKSTEADATEGQSNLNTDETGESSHQPEEDGKQDVPEVVVEEATVELLYLPEIEELVAKGEEYAAEISKHCDNLKGLCGKQFMADIMPTPFVKTMVFVETISYQDSIFIYDLLLSFEKVSETERNAIAERAPSLHEWLEKYNKIKRNKLGHANTKEKARALADTIGDFSVTKPLPPISDFKDASTRADINQYYPYTKKEKEAPVPQQRKELLSGHGDMWRAIKSAFETSFYGSEPLDPKTQYPKSWEKVAAFARVRQLSLVNHELDLQRFRIKIEEGLGFFPGAPGMEIRSLYNAKGKNPSTKGTFESINETIKKNKEEMKKMQDHFDMLQYCWV